LKVCVWVAVLVILGADVAVVGVGVVGAGVVVVVVVAGSVVGVVDVDVVVGWVATVVCLPRGWSAGVHAAIVVRSATAPSTAPGRRRDLPNCIIMVTSSP
jgi:hypothetical protein